MSVRRILAVLCALALLLPFGVSKSLAAEAETSWWEEGFWETENLVALGAELPTYNAGTGQYEISTPEQLLYLSGAWKTDDTNGDGAPDAPCNGVYVLTADLDMSALMEQIGETLTSLSGQETEGYMPPIASSTDETEEGGVYCAFFGTFDGQGHVISNLRIERMDSKYAGLFGNIGHDYGEGTVKNLALVNITVKSLASCGLLVGGLYGDVDNCVVIGTIDCQEKTAGGIAGKVKKNDNGYLGTVRNCFVYADITVRGEGGENGAAGGVTSAQSDGGRIYNCYVGGSITVLGEKAENVGGITGNLKSGQAIENCVMLLSGINVEDGTSVGLLCGSYSGETGSHLVNNYVWEGTQLSGHVTNDHPETAAYTSVGAGTIQSKSFYTDTLGWDFDTLWTWIGSDDAGYPMLNQFLGTDATIEGMEEQIASDLTIESPVLRASEPMTSTGFEGDDTTIGCTLTLPEGETADGVTLFYGADKDGTAYTDSVEMTDNGDGSYSALFPETAAGTWYYYFKASVGGETITFPNELSECISLEISSRASRLTPKQVTVSPGTSVDAIGMSWITDEGGLTAVLRYREAGASDWTNADVSEIYTAELANDNGNITSYSIDLSGLSPATTYEYQAVTNDGSTEYATDVCSFTTLPAGDTFSFLLVSDLQATTEEGYNPFLDTMNTYVADTLGGVDFVINLGDLTEDGSSMPQWKYMFHTLGDYFANSINAFTPGNHEIGSDLGYTIFKAETNEPGGMDDPYIGETTGSFVVGDVCFVILNTDPYSGLTGADVAADKVAFYEAEKAWAQDVFEASGCTWRIIAAHAGLIQDDATATAFLEQMCDDLDVDLYFNGHIHDYYRACVRGGQAAETGEGTTFITTSPLGLKFDDFPTGEIDDLLQFQTGGSDDERQYFTCVKVDDSGLVVTAYQLTAVGDVSDADTFADYTVIDSITLTQSLSSKDAEAAAETAAPAAEETAESAAGSNAVLWIIAAACIVAAAAVTAVVLVKRKKK